MKKIIPVTDLQRQAGQILATLSESTEPVIITQRGRATAVLLSANHYDALEKDLERLDELELLEMVQQAQEAKTAGQTLSHTEVKARLEKNTVRKAQK